MRSETSPAICTTRHVRSLPADAMGSAIPLIVSLACQARIEELPWYHARLRDARRQRRRAIDVQAKTLRKMRSGFRRPRPSQSWVAGPGPFVTTMPSGRAHHPVPRPGRRHSQGSRRNRWSRASYTIQPAQRRPSPQKRSRQDGCATEEGPPGGWIGARTDLHIGRDFRWGAGNGTAWQAAPNGKRQSSPA